MSLEFASTHCLCHLTVSIQNHARKWKLLVFSNVYISKLSISSAVT